MILISNHLTQLPQFKDLKDVVVRINMAHVRTKDELCRFLDTPHDVFLDYPKGRTKPPLSTLSMIDALEVAHKYDNIKYFAVSNIETNSEVAALISELPPDVQFVPKIETMVGVINLDVILRNNPIEIIMLDTEDLYTNVKNDTELYLDLSSRARWTCKNLGVRVLEMHGVVFNG